jgi:gliding motility-associatede transport system auxiliary component
MSAQPQSGMARAETGRPLTSLSWMWSTAFVAGMVLVFVGERALGSGTERIILSAAGVLLAAAATAIRGIRMRVVDRRAHVQGAAEAERVLFWLSVLGLGALALYFLQSDAMKSLLDQPLDKSSPKLATVLAALWPAVMACSLLPILMVEFSYMGMARAAVIEAGRVRAALYAGLGLSFALVFAFAAVYVGTNRDPKWDLSYFRTARPGEATHNIVRALQEPVEVSLFFPPANEVKEQAQDYFDALKGDSPFLQVKSYDQAVDVAKAKEFGVSGNGFLVFSRGARHELLSLGTVLESARSQLRNLDQESQKRILLVARAKRQLYFVGGHGERADDNPKAEDKRGTIRELRNFLRSQNYELTDLSASTGLAAGVPKTAGAVLVLGPTGKLLPEEAQAIVDYVHGGGRLMVALDPETGQDYAELLQPFGLKYTPTPLASDAIYATLKHQPSDKYNIVTGSYSSHPSVTSVAKLGKRAPIVMLGAGPLQETAKEPRERPKELSIDFTVHSEPATWMDTNGNFDFDAQAGEQRKTWELAAAVTYKKSPDVKPEDEGRVVVLGDSDLLTDPVIRYEGPAYFTFDSVKWLVGDEAIQGTTSSEVDVPVQHTKKDEAWWFYSTIFLAPALVVGAGLIITRRRGGRR